MRVAVMGSSGTGKSTIAEYISLKFSLSINPIGSRQIAKEMGFDNPYDVDKANRRAEFQAKLVTRKVEWEAANKTFVTDRTTLDNLVYAMLHDVHSIDETLLKLHIDGMKRYTHVFYCPMHVFCKVNTDPVRINDLTYQRLYDVTLLGALNLCGSIQEYHPLTDSTLDGRRRTIYGVLKFA